MYARAHWGLDEGPLSASKGNWVHVDMGTKSMAVCLTVSKKSNKLPVFKEHRCQEEQSVQQLSAAPPAG